jgi:hypothetical protein
VKFILRNEDVMARAMCALADLDIKDETYEVRIRPHRRDRSLEQNALLWALHGAASKYTGDSPADLHLVMCARFLGWREYKAAGEWVRAPITTTHGPDGAKLNVEEMAHFLTQVQAFYAELGVPLERVVDGEV